MLQAEDEVEPCAEEPRPSHKAIERQLPFVLSTMGVADAECPRDLKVHCLGDP